MEVRPLTLEDKKYFPEAIALLNRTQGRDLFEPDYLDKHCADPKSYVVAALKAKQLLGLGVVQLLDTFEYYLPFVPTLDQELKGKIVGSFSTLSVRESHQGQGIGQKISRERLHWAREKKCTTLLGVSWQSGLPHTSHRTFEKLGFHAVKKLDDFYVKSSQEKPFDCPGCHKIPCLCGAVLYRMDL